MGFSQCGRGEIDLDNKLRRAHPYGKPARKQHPCDAPRAARQQKAMRNGRRLDEGKAVPTPPAGTHLDKTTRHAPNAWEANINIRIAPLGTQRQHASAPEAAWRIHGKAPKNRIGTASAFADSAVRRAKKERPTHPALQTKRPRAQEKLCAQHVHEVAGWRHAGHRAGPSSVILSMRQKPGNVNSTHTLSDTGGAPHPCKTLLERKTNKPRDRVMVTLRSASHVLPLSTSHACGTLGAGAEEGTHRRRARTS